MTRPPSAGASRDPAPELRARPLKWLVTGAAGFIGSHLVQALLELDQTVTGLDNFTTGRPANLDEIRARVAPERWGRFRMIAGDLAERRDCARACEGVEIVLHQAGLGSVPRSLADPAASHRSNVTGFLNLLIAARAAGARRFIYASSSSVYGDAAGLPRLEDRVGRVLSPYAATKVMGETYAGVFGLAYQFPCIGLRYFNVFGPRQDPEGAYPAVIPLWIRSLLQDEPVFINGTGDTSRDFCFIDNVVHANLLAATTSDPAALDQVYNIALGGRTTLNELFALIQAAVRRRRPDLAQREPVYRATRAGDVRHSLADIDKARRLLGYEPVCDLGRGLEATLEWHLARGRAGPPPANQPPESRA